MLAGASCNDDPPVLPHPPGDGEKITLTLANVGMKDVTLHVRYRDSISSWTLSLVRDGRTIRTVAVFAQDTLLTKGSSASNINMEPEGGKVIRNTLFSRCDLHSPPRGYMRRASA